MSPDRPTYLHLDLGEAGPVLTGQAVLIVPTAEILRKVAARPDIKTTTFKGVRPRPSPDHTFRGA
tara:strand:- start:6891 stop:7085 length:195 start_codon:yes stop_codon:yes gene_type:complete